MEESRASLPRLPLCPVGLTIKTVMAGLVPAIHVGPTRECFLQNRRRRLDVDPRDKPGDDDPLFSSA